MTVVFGASAVALSVIALASVELARSDFVASRRNWERLNDHYRAESLVALTAWRLLHTEQRATLQWREKLGRGAADIVAEPEDRKLALGAAGDLRGRTRLAKVFGPATAERLLPKLVDLGRRAEPPSRSELLAIDDSTGWRRCGLSVVSTNSRLTDDALVAAEPSISGTYHDRTGEVWRIAVARGDRAVLDELIRFTGDDDQPIAVIDQVDGTDSPVDCAGHTQQEALLGPSTN